MTGDGLQVTGKEKPRAVSFVTFFCVLEKKKRANGPLSHDPTADSDSGWNLSGVGAASLTAVDSDLMLIRATRSGGKIAAND